MNRFVSTKFDKMCRTIVGRKLENNLAISSFVWYFSDIDYWK